MTGNEAKAPGVEIGRPNDTHRRVRIASTFGNVAVLVTDGRLPYPYGRELTGYERRTSTRPWPRQGVRPRACWSSYPADDWRSAFVQFPGGFIAEIHATVRKR